MSNGDRKLKAVDLETQVQPPSARTLLKKQKQFYTLRQASLSIKVEESLTLDKLVDRAHHPYTDAIPLQ
jgi:hypothetical protein